MKTTKRILIGVFLFASILSLRIQVNKDFDGNITLSGLQSEAARAALVEGKPISTSCWRPDAEIPYSIATTCESAKDSQCAPSDCPQ